MNESVESDALVMPSRMALPSAGCAAGLDDALILLAEPELVDDFFGQEFGVADFLDLHPAHHLADDDFQVLVVDGHALQPVDFLDLVHHVLLQFASRRARAGCRADCAARP